MAWVTTHASLLEQLRDRADDVAWAEFDRRYGATIVRYCRARGLALADAEDVRQIALMNFAAAAGGFRYAPERGRFRSYLGQVVRSAISRHLGRPDRAPIALDNGVLESIAEDRPADELWEREWVRHHLRLAMQAIRSDYAPHSVTVFDRLLAGRSIRDVAGEMDMSEEAVHKVKQRIRDRLRSLVAAQLDEEEASRD